MRYISLVSLFSMLIIAQASQAINTGVSATSAPMSNQEATSKPVALDEEGDHPVVAHAKFAAAVWAHNFDKLLAAKGKDPKAGNDRIIFSAQFNRSDAFYEGQDLGGGTLAAKRQCFKDKEFYEKQYGVGACDLIEQYSPGYHWLDSVEEAMTFIYVVVPAAVVGGVIASCLGVCAIKKLKQS